MQFLLLLPLLLLDTRTAAPLLAHPPPTPPSPSPSPSGPGSLLGDQQTLSGTRSVTGQRAPEEGTICSIRRGATNVER
ncbi:hypothetical protein NHX12_010057 [Muraenolepis orangiensis]|uniref:Uncharacterized protein n=1 Tax=Muraenolepis orangiensis TaxID=630683 RepID=A0A9Q0I8I6_9TELE|nr:hypothetical protein NHX12_010057 [Muraenolepis orangiensis]